MSPPGYLEVGSAEEARYLAAARRARLDPARARLSEHVRVLASELTDLPFLHLREEWANDLEVDFEGRASCACATAARQTSKLAFSFRLAPARDLMRVAGGFLVVSGRGRAVLEAAGLRELRFVPCLDRDGPIRDRDRPLAAPADVGPRHAFHQVMTDRVVVPTAAPRTWHEQPLAAMWAPCAL